MAKYDESSIKILEGLEACILRMGNLTSRFSEGKFQQNHFENAFVNRFKSILQIGFAPNYLLDGYVGNGGHHLNVNVLNNSVKAEVLSQTDGQIEVGSLQINSNSES